MRMNRRTFILGSGLIAATPALASVIKPSVNPGSSDLPAAVASPSDVAVTATAAHDAPFKIDGWEPREEAAADAQLWLSINQSWRANWR